MSLWEQRRRGGAELAGRGVAGGEISVSWRESCMLSRSVVSNSATPWTAAPQAPLSMEILQARILEWVAMPSSRESSQPRD